MIQSGPCCSGPCSGLSFHSIWLRIPSGSYVILLIQQDNNYFLYIQLKVFDMLTQGALQPTEVLLLHCVSWAFA